MTRYVVTTTAHAKADVRDIADYIASDNPTAAFQFAQEFAESVRQIGDFPHSGHVVNAIGTNLYVRPVSRRFAKYLVFYRQLDDANLEVVRVLHGARDLRTLLKT